MCCRYRKSGVGLWEEIGTHGVVERGEDGLGDGDDVGAVGEAGEAEQALELLQPDDDGRAAHEPHDGRVRQEVHQEPQPAVTHSVSQPSGRR